MAVDSVLFSIEDVCVLYPQEAMRIKRVAERRGLDVHERTITADRVHMYLTCFF